MAGFEHLVKSMRNHDRGALLLALLALAACTSSPKSESVPATPPAAPALDASYDWHGLLLLPFGTVFKDVPFALHEVLMFRDAAHAAQSDEAECYAIEQTVPRFLARTPSQYLLCFRHDHLARVEATVDVPQAEAADIFSNACDLWRRNAGAVLTGAVQAGAVQTGAGLPGAGLPAQTTSVGSGACDGRDGAIAYGSRLEENTEHADRALTMRLEALTQP